MKQFRLKYPDYQREYAKKNPEKTKQYCIEYEKRNKDRRDLEKAAYRKVNAERIRVKRNERRRWLYRNSPEFKLQVLVRSRLRCAIKIIEDTPGVVITKQISTLAGVGCTLSELRIHIESLFTSGMTWGNSGNGPGKWNIDHIKPIAAFDLKKLEDQLAVNHYTNLQPLWWEDNMKKSDKWEESA
jgi:hypothetical protein